MNHDSYLFPFDNCDSLINVTKERFRFSLFTFHLFVKSNVAFYALIKLLL